MYSIPTKLTNMAEFTSHLLNWSWNPTNRKKMETPPSIHYIPPSHYDYRQQAPNHNDYRQQPPNHNEYRPQSLSNNEYVHRIPRNCDEFGNQLPNSCDEFDNQLPRACEDYGGNMNQHDFGYDSLSTSHFDGMSDVSEDCSFSIYEQTSTDSVRVFIFRPPPLLHAWTLILVVRVWLHGVSQITNIHTTHGARKSLIGRQLLVNTISVWKVRNCQEKSWPLRQNQYNIMPNPARSVLRKVSF